MAWQTVGVVSVDALTEIARFGPVAASLDQGRLWLRLSTVSPVQTRPLAFAIVGMIDAEGSQPLQSQKHWPEPWPAVMHLGPGPFTSAAGELFVKPRSYNLKWLEVGLPARVWTLRAEVLGPGAVTDPRYSPTGIVRRLKKLFPASGPVGTSGAWRLRNG